MTFSRVHCCWQFWHQVVQMRWLQVAYGRRTALFSWSLTALRVAFGQCQRPHSISLTLSCRSSSTSTAMYVAASINCDSYGHSDDPFQMTLCNQSSSQVALTTVTLCCTASQQNSLVGCKTVLHAATRLITGVRRNQHITATLRDTLHWLPASQRIVFKIALMAFDCVHGQGPGYFDGVMTPVHTVIYGSGQTAICRLRRRGRSGLTYNSVRTAQLLLSGTNRVERFAVGAEKQKHWQTVFQTKAQDMALWLCLGYL